MTPYRTQRCRGTMSLACAVSDCSYDVQASPSSTAPMMAASKMMTTRCRSPIAKLWSSRQAPSYVRRSCRLKARLHDVAISATSLSSPSLQETAACLLRWHCRCRFVIGVSLQVRLLLRTSATCNVSKCVYDCAQDTRIKETFSRWRYAHAALGSIVFARATSASSSPETCRRAPANSCLLLAQRCTLQRK